MTDLTEQWQKGELPRGWYYIKDVDGDIYVAQNEIYYDYQNDKSFTTFWNAQEDVAEVLAKVPSYEEWEQLQNWADFTNDYHGLREKLEIAEYDNAQLKERLNKTQELELEVRKENAQLKELLKECRDVAEFTRTIVNKHKWLDGVITKINKALGEDK